MYAAGKDTSGRWAVYDTRARVWYYPAKAGKIGAAKLAARLNEEARA